METVDGIWTCEWNSRGPSNSLFICFAWVLGWLTRLTRSREGEGRGQEYCMAIIREEFWGFNDLFRFDSLSS